ncbi:MAG: hypothetical protein ABJG47_09235 [Ekhidna sp.]
MKKYVLLLLTIFIFHSLQAQLEQLDGVISEEEESQLRLIGENGSSSMFIDTSSDYSVRVIIKSEKLYVASLCVCNEKNEVIVMHASSALGDQTYIQSNDTWSTEDTFKWEVREVALTAEIIEKRRQYLEKHGWVANTVSMGKGGETEFFINRKLLEKSGASFALGLMTESDPENIIGIPAVGSGDCADFKLVSGDPATHYSFNPEKWIKIR